ncbi:hypothetical protein T492DRAFT_1147458 [Pavlovales sp. CCMP2436]|nr:hypothetical protein T492DRAFT_1147458 [Pavlovales sp. CCMP2436]
MAQSTFAECMCAALQLPPRAHTHAQFIGRNKLDAVLADTLTAISPSLSAIALRQRIDVVAGPAALALYARAIGLPALLLEDAPTAARPSLQSPRNGARVRPPGDLSLACALESVAGGLYACRSLGAVCRLLCGTLLPAVGAPRLAPFAMGGEAFAAEGALPSPSGEPSARRRDGAEWLAAQPSRLESGRTRRLFGPSAALDLSGFDSDAASDVSAHPSPFPSGHPSPRIAPRPEPHISARADMSPLSPRHASPRSQPRMGPLRESLGGVGTSAAAVVAAMAAAVSSCDSAANSAATTVAAAAASNPAAAAAEASALHADVAAIRREVGQTGQSVGEVLEAVRTLAKSLAALNYERI